MPQLTRASPRKVEGTSSLLAPPSMASSVRQPSSFTTPLPTSRSLYGRAAEREFPNIDRSNPKHQIAALTIQLAWRRYARRIAVRARAHRGLALIFARRARRQIQQQQAYAPMHVVDQWKPILVPVVRPPEFSFPSPAITSFNMAFDTYLTPLLHPVQRTQERRTRLEEISRRTRAVRDLLDLKGLRMNGLDDDDEDDDVELEHDAENNGNPNAEHSSQSGIHALEKSQHVVVV